ncbi:GtrA family protein [Helcobacillus massiliensis]|uniref:Putative flippase GtrA n=1 Tax=Helcobacillus massiliensis TaxID=521392 RepID=A0A839QSR6_9MICO|nr:putative flippase GtrA [Helcobacillus massiliensis]
MPSRTPRSDAPVGQQSPAPNPGAHPSASPDAAPAPAATRAARLRQALKFLTVGGLVFFIDAALYNVLVFWDPAHGFGAGSRGVLNHVPLVAKTVTIAFASVLTYLGNRLWTFNDRPAPRTWRSIVVFALVNVAASGLQLGCLGFSRYVLGLDSALADNISGTFIGQIVSTAFRYVMYGRVVFPKR